MRSSRSIRSKVESRVNVVKGDGENRPRLLKLFHKAERELCYCYRKTCNLPIHATFLHRDELTNYLVFGTKKVYNRKKYFKLPQITYLDDKIHCWVVCKRRSLFVVTKKEID